MLCENCHHESTRKCGNDINDNFLHLPLSQYSGSRDVDGLLEKYNSSSTQEIKCQYCHVESECTTRNSITTSGKVLIIRIGWFDKDQNIINENIKANENITLNDKKYRLKAMVHHEGTWESGHYVADLLVNDRWTRCNDEKIEHDVVPSNKPDILFYELGDESPTNGCQNKLECPECTVSYNSIKEFLCHSIEIHEKVPLIVGNIVIAQNRNTMLTCPFCGKLSSCKHLLRHTKPKHKGLKYPCPQRNIAIVTKNFIQLYLNDIY